MPCSLLLAKPRATGGVEAVLQSEGKPAADIAAGGSGIGVERGVNGEWNETLVGLALQMDCRVACTVELLWDVDLTMLAMEMNVDRKL